MMTSETYAKWRDVKGLMRENVDPEIFFQKYTMSEEIKTRLESIKEKMKDNIVQANPMWKMLMGEDEEIISSASEDNDDNELNNSNAEMAIEESMLESSTQFYFTQVERPIELEKSVAISSQKCDILESIYENLERNNGRLDFAQLENISDKDFILLVDELAAKLSSKGVYNLCQSMTEITIEQRMRYLNILCTQLLLPKIIELEEPSRLLSSAIGECVNKFPDEIQQFIFIPILNAELKDTSVLITMLNRFDPQKKTVLIKEFLASVQELKLWHISILQNFLSVRLDHDMIDKLIKLFSRKALYYSKDKTFGKFILSFLKVNTTLSEEQINLMINIAAVNETLFKRPIENILRNM